MKAYLGGVYAWLGATFCFINSYYAFRFPEKYIKARWTGMRGLPRHPNQVDFAGTSEKTEEWCQAIACFRSNMRRRALPCIAVLLLLSASCNPIKVTKISDDANELVTTPEDGCVL